MVVHRVVEVVELQMEEGEHSPGERDGSVQKERMKPDGRASDIDDTIRTPIIPYDANCIWA